MGKLDFPNCNTSWIFPSTSLDIPPAEIRKIGFESIRIRIGRAGRRVIGTHGYSNRGIADAPIKMTGALISLPFGGRNPCPRSIWNRCQEITKMDVVVGYQFSGYVLKGGISLTHGAGGGWDTRRSPSTAFRSHGGASVFRKGISWGVKRLNIWYAKRDRPKP